jgi:hypothetical protein
MRSPHVSAADGMRCADMADQVDPTSALAHAVAAAVVRDTEDRPAMLLERTPSRAETNARQVASGTAWQQRSLTNCGTGRADGKRRRAGYQDDHGATQRNVRLGRGVTQMRRTGSRAAATLEAVDLAGDPYRLREAPDRELVVAAATCAKALVRVADANAGIEIRERTFDLIDSAGRAIGAELRRRQ